MLMVGTGEWKGDKWYCTVYGEGEGWIKVRDKETSYYGKRKNLQIGGREVEKEAN
jgi:hypothetical protein